MQSILVKQHVLEALSTHEGAQENQSSEEDEESDEESEESQEEQRKAEDDLDFGQNDDHDSGLDFDSGPRNH